MSELSKLSGQINNLSNKIAELSTSVEELRVSTNVLLSLLVEESESEPPAKTLDGELAGEERDENSTL